MTENLLIENEVFDEVKRPPAFAECPNLNLALENCPSVFYKPIQPQNLHYSALKTVPLPFSRWLMLVGFRKLSPCP